MIYLYNDIQREIHSLKAVVRHFYAKRRVYGNAPAREWINELRRIRATCGFFESINHKQRV
jgi:hypothetical protein